MTDQSSGNLTDCSITSRDHNEVFRVSQGLFPPPTLGGTISLPVSSLAQRALQPGFRKFCTTRLRIVQQREPHILNVATQCTVGCIRKRFGRKEVVARNTQ